MWLFFLFKKILIKRNPKLTYFYLALLGLSWSTWDLVPWPGIEPVPPALGAWVLGHCTTREVPQIFNFLRVFLAVLGLCCCTQAFSSVERQGYSLLWCLGFSLWWPLLLHSAGSGSAGFSSCSTQHMGSFWTRDRTCVPLCFC